MANEQIANLLGIQPGGMGLYNYNYTLPNYNTLLASGLNEAQIANLDPNFATFNQFPYKAKPNPQQNFAQYEVVPQVGGSTPSNDQEDTEVTIDYNNQSDTNNTNNEVISTRYGDIRADDKFNTETLNLASVPLSQMSEEEIIKFGQSKGYIDENMRVVGPQVAGQGMNFASPMMALGAKMFEAPMQMLNDRQYNNYINALTKKGMYSQGGPGEVGLANFSRRYQMMKQKADFYNNTINQINPNIIGSSKIKIPGTAKFVNSLVNQYSPHGQQSDVVYHTQSGGYYEPSTGKFMTGYGQTVAHGSLQDAVDTIMAAAATGNVSTVPDKFLTDKYKDTIKALIKRGDFTQDQGNEIITAINTIKTDNKPKKEINKKKDYEPKYNTGGNDGMSQSDNQQNNVYVPYSSSSNLYRGNTSYGDADDYTDDSSGV